MKRVYQVVLFLLFISSSSILASQAVTIKAEFETLQEGPISDYDEIEIFYVDSITKREISFTLPDGTVLSNTMDVRTPSSAGHYLLRFTAVNETGDTLPQYCRTRHVEVVNPYECFLGENFPEPCDSMTQFIVSLPGMTHTNIEIRNLLGQYVHTIVSTVLPEGIHLFVVDCRDLALPSGIYFLLLETDNCSQTNKMYVTRSSP